MERATLLLALVALAAPVTAPVRPAARKHTDVVLPLSAGVPTELVPLKPGSTTEKVPAKLEAAFHIGPLSPISALAFSPDGGKLLVGTDSRIAVWDLSSAKLVRHLEGVEGVLRKVDDLAFSPDGKWLAAAGGDPSRSGTILVYDAPTLDKPAAKLAGDSDVVYSIAWGPDSRRLAGGSLDKLVKIWDVPAAKETFTIKDHSDFVYAVAFSPDGKYVASAGKDKAVKVTDASNGKPYKSFSGHNAEVLAVAFSPDSKLVISAGVEPQLRWWSLADGTNPRNNGGHGGEVYEIRLSKDAKSLVTVSSDQTARLWDANNGGQQKAFSSGGESLLAAALSPDGRRLAAGSWNGVVRLWDVPSNRLLALGFEDPERSPDPRLWFATPEGYVSGPDPAAGQLQWRVGGQPAAPEPFTKALVKPEEIVKALAGQAVSPPKVEPPK